jgi:multidrug efflux pump
MARFFIDRPVFAIVISLFLVLAGTLTLFSLPIAQFPNIALPTVTVNSYYLGASSDVVEEAVTTPIDQKINGVTDMLYIKSVSGNDGSSVITVTLDLSRDPDLAAVEVQNRVSQANSSLPSEVINAGVTVNKVSPDTLMFLSVYSPDGTFDQQFTNNYTLLNVVDALKRVRGIGDVKVFGDPFGMRIWLQPDKLASYGLTVDDVVRTIREQNVQAPAGTLGQPPAPKDLAIQYPVRVKGRLTDPKEFADMILTSTPSGSFVRIRDVGTVELGAKGYNFQTTYKRKPGTVVSIALAPGANALQSADGIKKELEALKAQFPTGLDYQIVVDNTEFVTASIEEVVKTFEEALILVLIVVFIFLQSWRATLIPMLAVPVSLVATFIAYSALGFSVNTLSLFGMVLAIGIVVDDAIVVVEAVEHIMAHEKLSPLEATRKAMDEVSGPVMAIALILAAVFVPMAFIPGITGQLYKQFALTVAVSVLFSALVALTLTPALCALMLKPKPPVGTSRNPITRFFEAFNRGFDWLTNVYGRGVSAAIRGSLATIALMGVVFFVISRLFAIVPGGFVPDEDMGYFFVQTVLPEGASIERTRAVIDRAEATVLEHPAVESAISIIGNDLVSGTAAPNAGFVVVRLKPWEERHAPELQLRAVFGQLARQLAAIPEAIVVPFNPPPIPGLGNTGGLSFMLQAPGGTPPAELMAATRAFLAEAQKRPEISRASTSFSAGTPAYNLDVDREKAKKLGVPINSVFTSLQAFLGGVQVNDFSRFGSNYKVLVQAAPEYRRDISALRNIFVKSATGELVPMDTLVTPKPETGYRYEWTGLARQEKEASGGATGVFILSILVVFLFLAALYESWAVPFAVLLAVPLGVLGALGSLWLVGLSFNVYAQIGLVTLVGLAAKNAILIVEFAKMNRESGMPLREAALQGAKLRLRPILMTSLAFILGCIPLAKASGAGAASKVSVGIPVIGGMIAATVLAVFTVPVLYVLIQGMAEKFTGPPAPKSPPAGHDHAPAAAVAEGGH